MMKQEPHVSVIVPNYNYARFLKQRIDSILEQTYQDFELILLDDASTDESIEMLESYKNNPHVSCLEVNTCNSGSPFTQWKKGIALARGKFIWIAESDDYAESTFLETTVSLLDRNESASFCFVGSHRVDEKSNPILKDEDHWGKKRSAMHYQVFEGTNYILHNLYWDSYVYNASGVLFRKESAEKVDNPLWLCLRCCGDWLFWTEMARRGQVIEVYKKINYFRYHSSSTSTQATKVGKCLEEDMVVVEQIENYFPHISSYKRALRHGMFYKKISRIRVAPSVKETLFRDLKMRFGSGRKTYLLERINKYIGHVIPFLLTPRRDRL